ncbi:MAG: hypothetical protein QOD38_2391 [Acidimicrobiaceae bacterium]|jgi:uncharacterized protein YndB with AHSA1/START domain
MGEARIHIEASPEAVYAMVSDITRMGEWSPENTGGEWLGGASAAAVGSRFKGKNKRKSGWSTKCTVTVASPGREFAFDVGNGGTKWRYCFEPAGAGTDVTESFEIVKEPGAIGRFFTKVGTGLPWSEREADMVRGMEQTLTKLKAAAEAS